MMRCLLSLVPPSVLRSIITSRARAWNLSVAPLSAFTTLKASTSSGVSSSSTSAASSPIRLTSSATLSITLISDISNLPSLLLILSQSLTCAAHQFRYIPVHYINNYRLQLAFHCALRPAHYLYRVRYRGRQYNRVQLWDVQAFCG